MRRIFLAGLTSAIAISGLALSPSPAAALTWTEVTWCVSAFSRNPKPSACMAAIYSLRCANRDNAYERNVQISACTAASESANWSALSLAGILINRGTAHQVEANTYGSTKRQTSNHRDEAIADYSQAIRLFPEDAAAFYDRGQVYHDNGDLDRAIADYSEAIRLDHRFSSAFSVRGDAYRREGDLDRAIADYSEALRLGRSGDRAFSAFEALRGRARAYRAKGEFDRAIADYDAAIRLRPDSRTFVDRGLTYLAKGDPGKAIADFSQALDDDPEDTSNYYYRGIANLYSGSLSSARSDFEEAWMRTGGDAYAALWFDMATRRGHLPSRLAEAAKSIDMGVWPAPIVRLYLGEMTEDAVLAAADDQDANAKTANLCDVNFFAGELALQRGAKDEAETLLRRAAASACGIIGAWAANADLKALGATLSDSLQGQPVRYPSDNDNGTRLPIQKYPPLPAPPANHRPPRRTISL